MTRRRLIGLGGALAWVLVSAAAPAFKDGVTRPPAEAVTGAPFDVKALFDAPPPDKNAAPLYLDALLEFAPETAVCFPEGPERDRRVRLTTDRTRRALELMTAIGNDPKAVTPAAIDAVVAEHREGFRKLAEAQKRDRCVFETGVGFTATLPHAQAAREVARVADLKARRELEKGDIDGAIGDVKTTLRLARDLQPRGFVVSQLVTTAITNLVTKSIVQPILAAPGLKPAQCDKLMTVLTEHEARSIDGFTTSLRMEYVSTRTTLLDLIHRQPKVARTMNLNPGDSVVKAVLQDSAPGAAQGNGKPALPDDVDARVARTSPAELNRAVERLNVYYSMVLALNGQPVVARLAGLPDAKKAFDVDDLLDRVALECQPALPAMIQAFGRAEANLAAAECLTAVRRWQLTHKGASPTDIALACKAAGLKVVPADPYDGYPMRLARINGEPVVYSIGKDGRDDGGKVDSHFDTKPGDQTFRLTPPGAGR